MAQVEGQDNSVLATLPPGTVLIFKNPADAAAFRALFISGVRATAKGLETVAPLKVASAVYIDERNLVEEQLIADNVRLQEELKAKGLR